MFIIHLSACAEFEKTEPVLDFVVKLCKNDGDKKMLKQVMALFEIVDSEFFFLSLMLTV